MRISANSIPWILADSLAQKSVRDKNLQMKILKDKIKKDVFFFKYMHRGRFFFLFPEIPLLYPYFMSLGILSTLSFSFNFYVNSGL